MMDFGKYEKQANLPFEGRQLLATCYDTLSFIMKMHFSEVLLVQLMCYTILE